MGLADAWTLHGEGVFSYPQESYTDDDECSSNGIRTTFHVDQDVKWIDRGRILNTFLKTLASVVLFPPSQCFAKRSTCLVNV